MGRLSINEFTTCFEDTGPKAASAIVLSNSLASDMSMWDALVDRLSQNFRVIRYDTRGHGKTSVTSGDYSLDQLADDVLDLTNALELDRFHFVGLSLGGMIGQLLAARHPDHLLSLTLCATFADAPFQMWDGRVKIARDEGISELVEPTLQRWLTPHFCELNPTICDSVRQMISATPGLGYAGCAAAIRDMDFKGVPEAITVPTMLVAAEQDPSAPPETMRELAARISGSQFVVIPDAAHLFTVEQPDAIASAILRFISGGQKLRSN